MITFEAVQLSPEDKRITQADLELRHRFRDCTEVLTYLSKKEAKQLADVLLQALQDMERGACEECQGPLDEQAIKDFQDGQPEVGLPRFCTKCNDRKEVEFLEADHDDRTA